MADKFVFRRDKSGKFDLSEDALRAVVGDHRIVMGEATHWPLGEVAEREFLDAVNELHFQNPKRSYMDCHRFMQRKRPILFALGRIPRAERGDTTATFQVAADGAA
jgi:hypothetical protein